MTLHNPSYLEVNKLYPELDVVGLLAEGLVELEALCLNLGILVFGQRVLGPVAVVYAAYT